jgi:capsular polysaccharide biosynthesis protein
MSITERFIAETPNISFLYFDSRDIDLLGRKLSRLVIHDRSPGTFEINDCVIPTGAFEGLKRSGVYDEDNVLVEGSARVRGTNPQPDREPDRAELETAVRDSRSAYYLGRGGSHFGHFLLETFCRAWAFEKCGAERVPVLQTSVPDYAHSLYRLVSEKLAEQIQIVSATTRFANVLVPRPGFVLKREAYREYKNLCVRLAERVTSQRGVPSDQPVYLSRSGLPSNERRALLGERRLEGLLESHGIRVVRPETLPIVKQIKLFNKHKWIIAPMGSACHGRLFAKHSTNLVMLCRSDFTTNFALCDRLSDGMAYYVNVISGLSERARYTEPLVLHEQRLLEFLKAFGLVPPSAVLDPPDRDLIFQKREWIRAARDRAGARHDDAIARAIGEVEATLKH